MRYGLFICQILFFTFIFGLTVSAAVHFPLLVSEEEYLIEPLLDRSDTARILAGNNIHDLLRKSELALFDDFAVFYNIDRNIVVNKAENIKVKIIDRAGDFNNILSSHLVGRRVLYDRDGAIKLTKL